MRMQSSRVALYPVSAIGTVTLNGVEVADGSVTQAFGQLIVEGGDYDIEGVTVRNNGVLWTPTATSDTSKTYTVQSNGLFEILAGGVVVFSWHNQMSQDFTIEGIYNKNNTTPNTPGNQATEYTYYQINSYLKSYGNIELWVKAAGGQDISELELSATNATVTAQEKASAYGDDYVRFLINLQASSTGQSVEVKLGDVLVVYIPNLG